MVLLSAAHDTVLREHWRVPHELHRENGFVYGIARREHAEPITRLLGDSFAHEPMSLGLGLTAQENLDFAARFVPECTANGLSIVAIPEDEPEKIVGVMISRDFKAPLPSGLEEDFPCFAPIVQALESVDSQYEALNPGLQPGQASDLWMAGVDPSSRYARRGIARNLFVMSVQVAHQRGFQRCVTACTSYYSQRCALGTGFLEKARINYQDFLFQGRRVFASIPAPHQEVILYERILSLLSRRRAVHP
jgi:ribosomal protein S18 acetylase RimI-like enzyme